MVLSSFLHKVNFISPALEASLAELRKFDGWLFSTTREYINKEILKALDVQASAFNDIVGIGHGGEGRGWNNFATIKTKNPQDWGWCNSYDTEAKTFCLRVWKEDTAPSWGDNYMEVHSNFLVSQMILRHLLENQELNNASVVTTKTRFKDGSDYLIKGLLKEKEAVIKLAESNIIEEVYGALIEKILYMRNRLSSYTEWQEEIEIETESMSLSIKPTGSWYKEVNIIPRYKASPYHSFLNEKFGKESVPFDVNV